MLLLSPKTILKVFFHRPFSKMFLKPVLSVMNKPNFWLCADTGQALIELLNNNSHMDLRHVSSRELKGQKLNGYDKREIIYESLTHEDVRRMSDIDCWIMALPNGVSKPWVDNIQENGNDDAIIVDLSADYRFDPEWTYGLPELINRSTICKAKKISNPGCYATAAQIGIAPLLPYLDRNASPTVIGHSGYSGAGTKPSPKNNVENLTNNIIPYSLVDHIHEREISTQLGREIAFVRSHSHISASR